MSNKLLKKALNRAEAISWEDMRALIEDQIHEADMLTELINKSPDGHCVLYSGEVKFVNDAFFYLVPADRKLRQKSEGIKFSDICLDSDIADFVRQQMKLRNGEEAEFSIQSSGSEIRIVRVSLNMISTDDGDYTDVLVRNITEDKRKEARLRRSENLASMTTMAAGIAHEIKNPLAAMQIHLQLLEKAFEKNGGNISKEKADRYLSVVEEEIERLNSTVVEFLFAVRPMNLEPHIQSVVPILMNIVEFVRPELEEHGIELVTAFDNYLPRIDLDADYFKQALLNIIKNAINAMEKGGKLTFSALLDGNYVLFKIADTGTGIPEEKLSKIFEPYFTTKANGTGLGLTVVFKVVKELQGDISVKSKVGHGTEFRIKLPVPGSERRAIEEDI